MKGGYHLHVNEHEEVIEVVAVSRSQLHVAPFYEQVVPCRSGVHNDDTGQTSHVAT